jgi:hypothetical protein
MFNKFLNRVKGVTQQIASQSYPKLVLLLIIIIIIMNTVEKRNILSLLGTEPQLFSP